MDNRNDNKINLIKLSRGQTLLYQEIVHMAAFHSPQNPVDFSYCDITSNDALAGMDLTGALFRNADCYDLGLKGCILTDCDFTDALNLEKTNFDECTMEQATADIILANGGILPDSVTIIKNDT